MPKMVARDPHQHHRTATPLELFFDLCFVVAVAQAAAGLHHGLLAGHTTAAVLGFAMAFFALWWAWMNFTWFASAYDVDDVLYRLMVFVQVIGVLVLAAGVPRAFEHDFSVMTIGYVVMRLGLVAQWLRAAGGDPRCRGTCLRYAFGITLCQIGWVAFLWLPRPWQLAAWLVWVPVELSVPVWSEREISTSWHPHHIAERYGLLTLIVLGESVLATTVAIQSAFAGGHDGARLIAVVIGAPLIVFSMWWLYFDRGSHAPDRTGTDSFLWGYGHYLIFASTAAVGAGLAVAVDHATANGHGHAVSRWVAGGAVAVPVAIYVMVVWFILVRRHEPRLSCSLAFPITAIAVLASVATGFAVPVTGGLLAGLVGLTVVLRRSP